MASRTAGFTTRRSITQQTLIQYELVDAYRLMIHPLVLGTGKRLFRDGTAMTRLRLVDTKPTSTGVLILTYEPA
jgi:dihydrofolate reductase